VAVNPAVEEAWMLLRLLRRWTPNEAAFSNQMQGDWAELADALDEARMAVLTLQYEWEKGEENAD
jgi:hypothetical protein